MNFSDYLCDLWGPFWCNRATSSHHHFCINFKLNIWSCLEEHCLQETSSNRFVQLCQPHDRCPAFEHILPIPPATFFNSFFAHFRCSTTQNML